MEVIHCNSAPIIEMEPFPSLIRVLNETARKVFEGCNADQRKETKALKRVGAALARLNLEIEKRKIASDLLRDGDTDAMSAILTHAMILRSLAEFYVTGNMSARMHDPGTEARAKDRMGILKKLCGERMPELITKPTPTPISTDTGVDTPLIVQG